MSRCEPHRDQIKKWFESGLSIERIRHDLSLNHGFEASYHSVYRFVQGLDTDTAKRVWRMECEPGQEAQIDYGTLYMRIGEEGRLKKVHVLLVTLSHSRKSYVEAVLSQNSESFLRSLENAFRHFGGVPERLCPDNLKAAVSKADWYEPELNPKLRVFDAKMEKITVHTRLEKGKYTEVLGAGGCRGGVVQSTNYFRGKVIPMGEHVITWADSMIATDKDRALRRLQGLLSLKGKYTPARINDAARKACIHGQYTLRDLRRWLESPHEQETFSFLQQHELIRAPHSYDSLAKTGNLFN